MRIIVSPAKKMKSKAVENSFAEEPVLSERTKEILNKLQGMSFSELKELWECSDKIASQNMERLKKADVEKGNLLAVYAYDGLVFQHIGVSTLDDESIKYLQKNLRILSAFYGVLKPFDKIVPYRLEMKNPLKTDDYKNLYEFWGKDIYENVKDSEGVIINLASKEYSKTVEKYIEKDERFISVSFYENEKGKLRQKGTFAKMARGEMVRFLAEIKAEKPERMKEFKRMNYRFRDDISTESEYIFDRIYE